MDELLTRCTNEVCSIRMSCARAATEHKSSDQQFQSFNQGQKDGSTCADFIVRAKLGAGDPDSVLRGPRKRHNAHAPARESYQGSEELFGRIFKAPKSRALPQRQALPKQPDLGVKRHIKHGRNIKDD